MRLLWLIILVVVELIAHVWAKIVSDGIWTGYDLEHDSYSIVNGNVIFKDPGRLRSIEAAKMVPYWKILSMDIYR